VDKVEAIFDTSLLRYNTNQTAENLIKLVGVIDQSSDIFFGIADRNTESETVEVADNFLSKADEFLNTSLNVLKLSQDHSNSSNKYQTCFERLFLMTVFFI
jgi:hypothetical protein